MDRKIKDNKKQKTVSSNWFDDRFYYLNPRTATIDEIISLNDILNRKIKGYDKLMEKVENSIIKFDTSKKDYKTSEDEYLTEMKDLMKLNKQIVDDRNITLVERRDLINGYNNLKAQDQLNTSVYNMYINAWNELDEITDDLEYLDRDIVRFMDRYVYRINKLRQKDLKYVDREK